MLAGDIKPWDCHPDLTEARLLSLAQFFADTRRELLLHHDTLKGDDSWSLGCRGFSWWRNRLKNIAYENTWPRLSIINPSKRFIFGIGTVPVRFFRGRVDNLPIGTLANNHDELRQRSFAFSDMKSYANLKWRFAIETDFLGLPSKVMFAGISDGGMIECMWSLPFDGNTAIVDSSVLEQEVQLPEPTVFAPASVVKKVNE